MKHLKKLNFVVLPLAIWAITVIYVLLNKFIGTFTQNMEPSPVILTILVLIFNLGLQLLIICASTIYAVKKLDLTLKRVVISLPKTISVIPANIKNKFSFLITCTLLSASNQRCYQHNDTVLHSYENRRFPRWHCRSVVKEYTLFICIYKDINERLII